MMGKKATADGAAAIATPAEKLAQIGDTVLVTTARGEHVNAFVKRVRGPLLIDVEIDTPTGPMTIERSPRDDAGKTADSWHFLPDLPSPDAA
jgi:hypothetical protein